MTFKLAWWLLSAFIAVRGKENGFPYSLPSVGPRADLGVQAVSPQVTISHPSGGRLPLLSVRPTVTFPAIEHHRLWPVLSYTAWWQMHIAVNNLPKVVMQYLNPQPVDCKSNPLPVVLLCQPPYLSQYNLVKTHWWRLYIGEKNGFGTEMQQRGYKCQPRVAVESLACCFK